MNYSLEKHYILYQTRTMNSWVPDTALVPAFMVSYSSSSTIRNTITLGCLGTSIVAHCSLLSGLIVGISTSTRGDDQHAILTDGFMSTFNRFVFSRNFWSIHKQKEKVIR